MTIRALSMIANAKTTFLFHILARWLGRLRNPRDSSILKRSTGRQKRDGTAPFLCARIPLK